jgi:hypothetical protein
MDNSTTVGGLPGDDEHDEYTIEEQIDFTREFKKLVQEQMPPIVELSKKILSLKKVESPVRAEDLQSTICLMQKMSQTLQYTTQL